jgi:hypothetical protein
MSNPFYLQEIPTTAPFCNRISELDELVRFARAKANIVLYSPRRYGKTSLVKRVQKRLSEQGAITIFADFFGVTSEDDVAARLAKAVFAVTHQKEPLWKNALKVFRSFRPVLKPDTDGTFSLSVEPAGREKTGLQLLEETLESLGEFIQEHDSLVNITLDEFQEIVTLKPALQIEALMRTHIQRHHASYFFVGSRRRVLLGIFNERQRPFFQSSINYPIPALPEKELAEFIAGQFTENGKSCDIDLANKLAVSVNYHPYYSQKLAFFTYEQAGSVSEESLKAGLAKLLSSETPVFEAILQGLTPKQKLLLTALAKTPTKKIMASSYIHKFRLGSIGGIQNSIKHLEELDLIEKEVQNSFWQLVDPVFAQWLKQHDEEKL